MDFLFALRKRLNTALLLLWEKETDKTYSYKSKYYQKSTYWQ